MPEAYLQGFRLSPQQEHVWRLSCPRNIVPRVCAQVRVPDDVSLTLLLEAIVDVMRGYEVLRTALQQLPGMSVPLQVIRDDPRPEFRMLDLTHMSSDASGVYLASIQKRLCAAPLDYERGPVLTAICTCLHDQRVITLSLPTLFCDHRSMELLVREILRSCAAHKSGMNSHVIGAQYLDISETLIECAENASSHNAYRFWLDQCLPTLEAGESPEAISHGEGNEGS